jgi:hypothetical protein
MAREEVYCPECEGFQPLVREPMMPATCLDLVEGDVGDLVCGSCRLLIATLRTVRGLRRGERARA